MASSAETLILGWLCTLLFIQVIRFKSWVLSAVILMLITAVITSLLTTLHAVQAEVSLLLLMVTAALIQNHAMRFSDLVAINGLLFIHILAGFINSYTSTILITLFIVSYLVLNLIKSRNYLLWVVLLVLSLWWLLTETGTMWYLILIATALHMSHQLGRTGATEAVMNPAISPEELLREVETAKLTERSRIYQNIHDDVGAELLKLIYELEDDAQRAQVKKVMNQLRNAVAQTAHYKINLLSLLEEISTEIKLRSAGAGLTYQDKFKVNNDFILAPEVPVKLQRIIRELVNNCIKHAQATQITFSATVENQKLLLQITDDGLGFKHHTKSPQVDNTATKNIEGRGLKALQKRAADINATIQWQTISTGGTAVTLEMSGL